MKATWNWIINGKRHHLFDCFANIKETAIIISALCSSVQYVDSIAISELPLASSSKRVLVLILSYEKEFNLHVNEISFSHERMSTKTRFEEQAKGNSEMAYRPFYRYGGHFELYCFKKLLWDDQGAHLYVFAPEHIIIAIWNNRIQNGRRIGKKVYCLLSPEQHMTIEKLLVSYDPCSKSRQSSEHKDDNITQRLNFAGQYFTWPGSVLAGDETDDICIKWWREWLQIEYRRSTCQN